MCPNAEAPFYVRVCAACVCVCALVGGDAKEITNGLIYLLINYQRTNEFTDCLQELLARKKALLEEAARKHKNNASSATHSSSPTSSVSTDADRLRRAEECRQVQVCAPFG